MNTAYPSCCKRFNPKLIEISRMGPSSSKDRHKTRSETLSYDDTGDENGNDKLALRAPFTEYNFKKVQEKFCLPPATPWAIRSQHPHFEQHIMEIADATIGS